MKNFQRMLFAITVMMLVSAVGWAQPAIAENGVLNASSYTAGIARGSWFAIFGSGMGPAKFTAYSGALPYPIELSGTKVSFTPAAGGSVVDARMWYTSAGQVGGMLPSTTPAGDYDVKLTFNGQTSAARRVKVVERNFGINAQNMAGQGPAAATYGGLTLNRFTKGQLGDWAVRPAKPGDVVVLWGTGLGADPMSDLDGNTSGDMKEAAQVKVNIDGIEVTPLYAGRSSGSPGLDQVNFVVPSNVALNCLVLVQVIAGGRTSNTVTIAVATDGQDACNHPALSDAQLAKLEGGGTISIGSLSLTKMTSNLSFQGMSFDTTIESASGSFVKYGIADVATADFSRLRIGQCFVVKRTGTLDDIMSPVPPARLDAGLQLTLNGPNASNKIMPKDQEGDYGLTLYNSGFSGIGGTGSPTLVQGTYTIAGPGGADIGSFSTSIDFPGAFSWTHQGNPADPISRATALKVDWTGGGSGLVEITGIAAKITGGTQEDPVGDATVFNCVAQASAGTFTVPTSVLQQLPAVAAGAQDAVGYLQVLAIPDMTKGQGRFDASGLDRGFISYAVGSSKTTAWQ
ncbi:MAG: hypothetical protein IT158_22990 [Bryobacterales bacterium]|nr:hypothetical protein [Bryobacterales bacterium]